MNVLALLAVGALAALCFDLFRCLRRAYKNHPGWLIHTEDGICFIVASVLLVAAFCVIDYGQVRWYTFVLSILGGGIYFMAVSPWLGKIITFFMSIPGKIIKIFKNNIEKH